VLVVTSGTTWQPSDENTSDRESRGNEGVLEVTFTPHIRASSEDAPFRARGENAATAR
jgi:hypothetical protein